MAVPKWTPVSYELAGRPYSTAAKQYAIIGNYNTFTNWHLVPNSRLVVALPEQKKQTVDIPGGNGVIDLSMALNKFALFNRRSGTLSFTLLPGYDAETVRSSMANNLHGRKSKLTLSDDLDFYYYGYFSVNWTSNEDGSSPSVEIEYDLEPYKTAHEITYINDLFSTPSVSSASTAFTMYRYNKSPRPNAEIPGTSLPTSFPTPLIVEVTSVGNNAACDILFGNSYLGMPLPPLNETNDSDQAISHYYISKAGTYEITKYPVSSRNSSSDTIYINVNNTTLFMPSGSNENPNMTLRFGYRRKRL